MSNDNLVLESGILGVIGVRKLGVVCTASGERHMFCITDIASFVLAVILCPSRCSSGSVVKDDV